MAVRKQAEPDPLTKELPPEPAPLSADDVEFQVVLMPHVLAGEIKWTWEIVDHNAKQHVGDYTGLNEFKAVTAYVSAAKAETDARRAIERIREAIALKLNMPSPVKLTL